MDARAGRPRSVVKLSGKSSVVKAVWAIIALVLLLRLPFLHQAIQGDDVYYLAAAEHAQIDPLHPNGGSYVVQGDLLDLRGYPHAPLNAWILAALLAALGDVREVPFHLAYTLFSLIAALAIYSLARRFCEKPFLATLLFLAVPAFVERQLARVGFAFSRVLDGRDRLVRDRGE
jgi:4-amino-4-deoxy-L-arabinose transferase-like glycosyltransferase